MHDSRVAVFGSSEPRPGDGGYERARRVGALLARAGLTVVTGGYGGVMEAASRGAREEGGAAIGVTVSTFASRSPNSYLTQVIEEPDLFARTRRLMALSAGFIILPGKSGTLAEAAFLWALRRAGELGDRPVVLLGPEWAEATGTLVSTGFLDEDGRRGTILAGTVEESVRAVTEAISRRPERH